jgi:hypothetical protein
MSTLATARKLTEKARAQLALATHQLNRQETVDLTGAVRAIDSLMQSIAKLSPSDAVQFKGALIALHDECDRLEGQLKAAHAGLAERLRKLGAGTQAADAYARRGSRS